MYRPLYLIALRWALRGKKTHMGYAVYHIEKSKGSGGGLGGHIDRSETMKHTYQHADPSRLHLNKSYPLLNDYDKMKIHEAVKDRIEKGYKSKRKMRTDSVKQLSHIMTGSHEDMKKIFSDRNTSEQWINSNLEFMKEQFGAENIVRFTLHMDEKTPHIHCVTVPLTEDGRLSAKEMMGGREKMSARQDRYAELMKPYGLERGIKGSGVKHEKANEYHKRMEDALSKAVDDDFINSKTSNMINHKEVNKELREALKSSNLALNDLKAKNIKSKKASSYYQEKTKEAFESLRKSDKERKKIARYYQSLIYHPEKGAEFKKKHQEELDKIFGKKIEPKIEVKKKKKDQGKSM